MHSAQTTVESATNPSKTMADWQKLLNMQTQTPWLLFPISPIEKTRNDFYVRPEKAKQYGLINITGDHKLYPLELPEEIQSTHSVVGVYKTWLLMCYEDSTIFLLNPFTGKQVLLPNKKISIISVSKFVVSDELAVVVIHGGQKLLTYCKPGDETWNVIKHEHPPYADIVHDHYDGNVYALDEREGVVRVRLTGRSSPTVEQIKLSKQEDDNRSSYYYFRGGNKAYIVGGSCGKLLLIKRTYSDFDKEQTSTIIVYELDVSRKEWVRVKNLGDSVLFVGDNYCCALPLKLLSGCRENCIYFADHYNSYPVVFHDIGAYDMSDTSIEHLAFGRGLLDFGNNFLAGEAAWITPSLS